MSDEVFDKVMRNNVLSNAWLCNLVYPDMKAQKDGAIVIVSSIGGLHGSSVIGAYNLSKAADMQLARNLAVEWGPDNIRVNCIAPGLIKTDFAKALHEDPTQLVYAASILVADALLLAAWGLFVYLNRAAEELEPEAMADAKREDKKLK